MSNVFKTTRLGVLALLLPAMGFGLFGSAASGTQEVDDDASTSLTSSIHTGTCDQFDAEPRFALSGFADTAQDDDSDEGGNVASYTDLSASTDTLLAQPHVIVVLPSGGGDAFACGEIGDNSFDDGGLAVGLVERSGSGHTGFAYLSPANGSTGITLLLGSKLIEDEDDSASAEREDEAADDDIDRG